MNPPHHKTETCMACFRRISKHKLRKEFGNWFCHPKGHYKNAIECLHVQDDDVWVYRSHRFPWIKPADIVSFIEKEIEKAGQWLAQGELNDKQYHDLVRRMKEAVGR